MAFRERNLYQVLAVANIDTGIEEYVSAEILHILRDRQKISNLIVISFYLYSMI